MRLRTRVGLGEAEAIVLAQQIHAHAVVLDDATTRQVAEQEGCPVVGLLGLLVDGKRRGLLSTVKPLLDAMRERPVSSSERSSIQRFFDKSVKNLLTSAVDRTFAATSNLGRSEPRTICMKACITGQGGSYMNVYCQCD